jgi:hypothetical protein
VLREPCIVASWWAPVNRGRLGGCAYAMINRVSPTVRYAVTVLLLALPSILSAQEPPAGFEWKVIPEIKAKFLIPPGWHFVSESPLLSQTHTYLITKEDFALHRKFDTGMRISVERLKGGANVTEQAAAFIHTALATGTLVQPFFEEDFGTMKAFGGVVSLTSSTPTERFTVALNAIANPRTNVLYKLSFQSPADSWDSAWAVGRWLIGKFSLDDEY